jgi:hypothetical protein
VTTTSTPAPAPARVVQPAPQSTVAGTRAAAATARVSARRSCPTRSARVTMTGRSIRQVTFLVNGRRARIVTVRAGARRLTVSVRLSRSSAARQRITARVMFRNGAAARTLNTTARRCAHAAVGRSSRAEPRPSQAPRRSGAAVAGSPSDRRAVTM